MEYKSKFAVLILLTLTSALQVRAANSCRVFEFNPELKVLKSEVAEAKGNPEKSVALTHLAEYFLSLYTPNLNAALGALKKAIARDPKNIWAQILHAKIKVETSSATEPLLMKIIEDLNALAHSCQTAADKTDSKFRDPLALTDLEIRNIRSSSMLELELARAWLKRGDENSAQVHFDKAYETWKKARAFAKLNQDDAEEVAYFEQVSSLLYREFDQVESSIKAHSLRPK